MGGGGDGFLIGGFASTAATFVGSWMTKAAWRRWQVVRAKRGKRSMWGFLFLFYFLPVIF